MMTPNTYRLLPRRRASLYPSPRILLSRTNRFHKALANLESHHFCNTKTVMSRITPLRNIHPIHVMSHVENVFIQLESVRGAMFQLYISPTEPMLSHFRALTNIIQETIFKQPNHATSIYQSLRVWHGKMISRNHQTILDTQRQNMMMMQHLQNAIRQFPSHVLAIIRTHQVIECLKHRYRDNCAIEKLITHARQQLEHHPELTDKIYRVLKYIQDTLSSSTIATHPQTIQKLLQDVTHIIADHLHHADIMTKALVMLEEWHQQSLSSISESSTFPRDHAQIKVLHRLMYETLYKPSMDKNAISLLLISQLKQPFINEGISQLYHACEILHSACDALKCSPDHANDIISVYRELTEFLFKLRIYPSLLKNPLTKLIPQRIHGFLTDYPQQAVELTESLCCLNSFISYLNNLFPNSDTPIQFLSELMQSAHTILKVHPQHTPYVIRSICNLHTINFKLIPYASFTDARLNLFDRTQSLLSESFEQLKTISLMLCYLKDFINNLFNQELPQLDYFLSALKTINDALIEDPIHADEITNIACELSEIFFLLEPYFDDERIIESFSHVVYEEMHTKTLSTEDILHILSFTRTLISKFKRQSRQGDMDYFLLKTAVKDFTEIIHSRSDSSAIIYARCQLTGFLFQIYNLNSSDLIKSLVDTLHRFLLSDPCQAIPMGFFFNSLSTNSYFSVRSYEEIQRLSDLIMKFISSQPTHLFDLLKVNILLDQTTTDSKHSEETDESRQLIRDVRDARNNISLYPQHASDASQALGLSLDYLKYPPANSLYQAILKLISKINSKCERHAISDTALLLSNIPVSIHTPNSTQCDVLLRSPFEKLAVALILLLKRSAISIDLVLETDIILLLQQKYLCYLTTPNNEDASTVRPSQSHAANIHLFFYQQRNDLINQAKAEINDCCRMLLARRNLFLQNFSLDLLNLIMTFLTPRLTTETKRVLLIQSDTEQFQNPLTP